MLYFKLSSSKINEKIKLSWKKKHDINFEVIIFFNSNKN